MSANWNSSPKSSQKLKNIFNIILISLENKLFHFFLLRFKHYFSNSLLMQPSLEHNCICICNLSNYAITRKNLLKMLIFHSIFYAILQFQFFIWIFSKRLCLPEAKLNRFGSSQCSRSEAITRFGARTTSASIVKTSGSTLALCTRSSLSRWYSL